MSKYRILTFDSGGIRGLLSILLIEQMDEKLPGWRDNVDLIAGTSTGGIIALALANGIKPDRLKDFYLNECEKIFEKSYIREFSNIVEADYDNKHLSKVIYGIFKHKLLKHLKTNVLIPTFDLDNEDPDPLKRQWKPKFFHNFRGRDNDGDEKAADVAMYTTAAPVLFPSVDGYIDGCVIAVNPSMSALAQTQDSRNEQPAPSFSDIVMLSVGTGTIVSRIEGKRHDWGYGQWLQPMIRIMFDGASEVTDYQCRQFLNDRYHRIDYKFSPDDAIAVDDYSKTDKIIDIAQTRMSRQTEEAFNWISDYWL